MVGYTFGYVQPGFTANGYLTLTLMPFPLELDNG